LKFEITEIDGARKKMELVVPSKEVDSRVEESFRKAGKSASLKGFRPGKVPRNLLEKFYGSQVRAVVAEELVKEFIGKALDETGIQPVAPPLVDPGEIKKGEDFSFTAEIEVLPKIEKVNYDGIEIEVPSAEVTDEDVDQGLENLRLGAGELKKPEPVRPVKSGDYVIIDLDAKTEEKSVGSEKDMGVEVGSGMMPAEFEEGLVGLNEGDQKTMTVKYAEDVQSPLAGETVTFDVVVRDIKERVVPDLDDEFAKDMGKENLSELKDHLKGRLCERKESESREKTRREMLKLLREKNPIDLPPTLVDNQRQVIVEETKQRFDSMKIPFREDQFGEEFNITARERVHDDVLVNAIADAENIRISDEEVEAKIGEWAREVGQDPAKLKATLSADDRLEQVKYKLREDKTVDFLMSAATIKCIERENQTPDTDTPESSKKKKSSKRGKK